MKRTRRQPKIEDIVEFFGKGLWNGDLSEMREDRPRPLKHKKIRRRASTNRAQ
jgi:hypothetical protein